MKKYANERPVCVAFVERASVEVASVAQASVNVDVVESDYHTPVEVAVLEGARNSVRIGFCRVFSILL